MPKSRTHFLCNQCGGVQSRWMGKCPDCGAWDALEKFTEPKLQKSAADHAGLAAAWVADDSGDDAGPHGVPANPVAAPLPEIQSLDLPRIPTTIGEFDRVLGGGLVPGSLVLLGGDPGIGKSTLLLQGAARLAADSCRTLYVSSEESAQQIKLRAQRLSETSQPLHELYILAETNLARIVEQAKAVRPAVLVIDSIQMIYKPDLDNPAGSIAQLRRCCLELTYLAKVSGVAIQIVGHVTKEGHLAGPKMLEHLVDVVLSFEGDRHHDHRIVRGVKNRFGATQEVGLFAMTGRGLEEVAEGSLAVDPDQPPRPGTAICPAMHGSRCLLAEIQALTATGFLGAAKRRASGLDSNRLAMLIAVLEKHGGLRLADQDIFASAAGGLRLIEPAVDLALCLAIISAHYNRTLPAATAVVGEVGLGGEIRPVTQLEQRVRDSQRLGYRRVIVPSGQDVPGFDGVELFSAATLGESMKILE